MQKGVDSHREPKKHLKPTMKNAGMLVVCVCLTFALGRIEGTTTTETSATGVSSSTDPRNSSPTATTAQPGSSTRISDAGTSQNTATGTSPQQSGGSTPTSTPASPGTNTATTSTTTSKGARVASFGAYGHILMPVVFVLYGAHVPY